jgi:hypothetical protein
MHEKHKPFKLSDYEFTVVPVPALCTFPNGDGICPVCGVPSPDTARPRSCVVPVSVSEVTPALPTSGPGTELKKLLAGWPFYITSSPDCSCNRVAREMDAWGADECETPEKQDYILAAMRENAEKRGLPFIDAAGRFLIRRAIKNARKNKIDQ